MSTIRDKSFCGVDGEGAGTDHLGRQQYRLLRAGEFELYDNGRPLETEECLEFITGLPRDRIYVGFFFDYDSTQILRDLNGERRERLLHPNRHGERGFSPYVDWRQFQIDYMPRKYLRVRRPPTHGEPTEPGITINDVGGFFQCSFVKALEDWGIGTAEQRKLIKTNKDRRDDFTEVGETERDYCALECWLLAEMMEKLREACRDAGYVPQQWQGAGYLSAAMLKKHKVPKRQDVVTPEAAEKIINDAYYGGRFEVTRIGQIGGTVHEYDIASAYPRAMLGLPCLVHGYWSPAATIEPTIRHRWVADITFDHPESLPLYNLPIRQKSGVLCWPKRGRGVYWDIEILAAIDAGTEIRERHAIHSYVWDCNCRPFNFLPAVYAERKRIGKEAKGKPLKLGMNGMYGKTAQSIGSAPWGHRSWAGMITATCRARLIEAYRDHRDHIAMIATDALYSTTELPVEIGDNLGDWEHKSHDGMFIVQPGLYWYGDGLKPKTRGIPQDRILAHQDLFVAAWRRWRIERLGIAGLEPPSVPVPVKLFIGLRLAQARGKPELAGMWKQAERVISFDWKSKRGELAFETLLEPDLIFTLPKRQGADFQSKPYTPKIAAAQELSRWEVEAMPDYAPPLEVMG